MSASFRPILTNKRVNPYRKTGDKLAVRVETLVANHISYIADLQVDLYLNSGGSWSLVASDVTNSYGICDFEYSLDATGVSNCLGKALVTYNGSGVYTNTVRFNFRD